MNSHDEAELERYRRTERKREKERQIRYQESLGSTLTWKEREIAALDLFEGQWKRGMAPKTY
jgi:hypothetical protein